MLVLLTNFKVGFELKRPNQGHVVEKLTLFLLTHANKVVKRSVLIFDKAPCDV